MGLSVKNFSDTLIELSKELVDKAIEDALQKARDQFEVELAKERIKLLNTVQYVVRHDAIGDRVVFTLELKEKK